MAAMVRKLSLIGQVWSKAERDTWKKAFDGLLDYTYPAKEPTKESNAASDGAA